MIKSEKKEKESTNIGPDKGRKNKKGIDSTVSNAENYNTSKKGLDEKNQKVQELEKEIAELNEEKKRLIAEKINAGRQYQQQLLQIKEYGNQKIIKETLSVLDGYERAVKFSEYSQDTNVKPFIAGLNMDIDRIRKFLQEEGVKEIKVELCKDKFDGRYHEVMEEEESDKYPDETIMQVLKKGYFLHERVISPAKVKISRRKNLEEKR